MGLWEQGMESYGLKVMGLGVKLRRSKVVMFYFSCQPDRIYNYQRNCYLDMPVKIILITLIGMWRSILIVLRIVHWEGDPGLDMTEKVKGAQVCWLILAFHCESDVISCFKPLLPWLPHKKGYYPSIVTQKKYANMDRENFTGPHS